MWKRLSVNTVLIFTSSLQQAECLFMDGNSYSNSDYMYTNPWKTQLFLGKICFEKRLKREGEAAAATKSTFTLWTFSKAVARQQIKAKIILGLDGMAICIWT